MSVLIRNGRIVTAADDYRADVFVEGETVALIGRDLTPPADRIIDATGRLVLPGGVDPHTHMEMPFGGTESSDTFETGTRAAAFGGTTTIVDFAIQSRAASIFGMFPRKGTIAVGSDADIVVFDPEREVTISSSDPRTHHMNVDYSAYEGFRVRGCPETVLSRGRVVVDNGEYVGRPGDGQFIRRGPYGGAHAPLAAARGQAGDPGGGRPGAGGD